MNPYPLLQGRLQVRRLRVHPVAGHGNSCQFRALAHAIGIGVDQHFHLRLNLVRYIQLHPAEFVGFIQENNIHAYGDRMRREGVCGDNLTLQAAADLFGVDIVLVRADGPEETTTINGRSGQRGTINLIFYPEPDDDHAGHYDATDPIGQTPLEEVEEVPLPLLTSWGESTIGEEVARNSICTRSWLVLIYDIRNSDDPDELIMLILDKVTSYVQVSRNCLLRHFLTYSEQPPYWMYTFINIDYGRYADGTRRLSSRNARLTFTTQFDLDNGYTARLFHLYGHPHPLAVEWDPNSGMRIQRQDNPDRRCIGRIRATSQPESFQWTQIEVPPPSPTDSNALAPASNPVAPAPALDFPHPYPPPASDLSMEDAHDRQMQHRELDDQLNDFVRGDMDIEDLLNGDWF